MTIKFASKLTFSPTILQCSLTLTKDPKDKVIRCFCSCFPLFAQGDDTTQNDSTSGEEDLAERDDVLREKVYNAFALLIFSTLI